MSRLLDPRPALDGAAYLAALRHHITEVISEHDASVDELTVLVDYTIELRRAVRDWYAARALAFRHDDRPNLYPTMAAWRKAGEKKWQRANAREQRVIELVTTRPKEANP
ncbi:MAG TPA: hypothetical protein VMU89_14975 [Thermomicrobiaceae bacterium]|nr:hypothetical protein [Thermomicrobiaceae bacterium]